MKKHITLFLVASMILSVCSCAKEDSGKTNSPKFQIPTEDVASVSSETTTETSETSLEPTSESSSEDTSATNPAPVLSPDEATFTIDHSLQSIELENIPQARSYGYCCEMEEYAHMVSIEEYYDFYCGDFSKYEALKNTLSDIYEELFAPLDQAYDDALPVFINSMETTTDTVSEYYGTSIEVYRSDSQIYSFVAEEYFTNRDYDESNHFGITAYNLRSSDGSTIQLCDVIVDTDAFCSYLESYFSSLSGDDLFNKAPLPLEIESMIDEIQAGTEPFVLSYDSIYLYCNCLFYKVPVYPAENIGCINMTYFGATPAYYAIELDQGATLQWDVNGDNTIDDLSIEVVRATSDEDIDLVSSLNVSLNGQQFVISEDVLDPYSYDARAFYIQADDGQYLWISLVSMDTYTTNLIYQINGDTLSFVCTGDGFLTKIIYDPGYFELYNMYDIIGTASFTAEFAMMGTNGFPMPLTNIYYSYDSLAAAKIEFEATEIDIERNAIITKTIPVDTPIEVICYDADDETVVFQTLHEDADQNCYFEIPHDYETVDKYFKGIVHAG